MCDIQDDIISNGIVGDDGGEFICYDDENNVYLIEIEDDIDDNYEIEYEKSNV